MIGYQSIKPHGLYLYICVCGCVYIYIYVCVCGLFCSQQVWLVVVFIHMHAMIFLVHYCAVLIKLVSRQPKSLRVCHIIPTWWKCELQIESTKHAPLISHHSLCMELVFWYALFSFAVNSSSHPTPRLDQTESAFSIYGESTSESSVVSTIKIYKHKDSL